MFLLDLTNPFATEMPLNKAPARHDTHMSNR